MIYYWLMFIKKKCEYKQCIYKLQGLHEILRKWLFDKVSESNMNNTSFCFFVFKYIKQINIKWIWLKQWHKNSQS